MTSSTAAPVSSPIALLEAGLPGSSATADPTAFSSDGLVANSNAFAALLLLFPANTEATAAGVSMETASLPGHGVVKKISERDTNAELAAGLLVASLSALMGPAPSHSSAECGESATATALVAPSSQPPSPMALAGLQPSGLTEALSAEPVATASGNAALAKGKLAAKPALAEKLSANMNADQVPSELAESAPRAAPQVPSLVETSPLKPKADFSISLSSAPGEDGPASADGAERPNHAAPTPEAHANAQAGTAPTHVITHADAPKATVAPLSVADQIQNHISAHLDQLKQSGRLEVQINLHPPELGRVQMHLAIEDGHMNVRMVVQDDAVKRVVDSQLDVWRVRFSQMGVSVGQFDVRRDGGSPLPFQQNGPEPSAQAIQTENRAAPPRRNAYDALRNAGSLVDVMA